MSNPETTYRFANRPLEFAGELPLADILEARTRGYPVPVDPDQAVERTLAAHDLTRYPSPIPSPSQYISARIRHSDDHHPGFNYGTFVTTQTGEVGFAKLRYGPRNTEKTVAPDGDLIDRQVGGLQREAKVLQALGAAHYIVPAVFGYYPASSETVRNPEPDQADTLETLCIGAITPDQGSTKPPELWTPGLAAQAAGVVRTFAQPVSTIEAFSGEESSLPLDILLRRARLPAENRYSRAALDTIDDYKDQGDLNQPIVVHGDSWLNNIIVRHDDSEVMFVDWELAGPGHTGQDAGRTLWGLTLDEHWDFAGMNDTANAFVEAWCESQKDARRLRFGIMFESFRWIADRQDKLHLELQETAQKEALEEQIQAIQAHALAITERI